MVDFEDFQHSIYRAIEVLETLNKEIGRLDGALDMGAESVDIKDLKNLVRGLYYNNDPVAEEYIHLSNKIRNIIRDRLIEKHDKYKDTWKQAKISYLKKRVKFLYELLFDDWETDLLIDKPKKLLDVAIQCILLYLRLKEEE